jgi:hypothetical protein
VQAPCASLAQARCLYVLPIAQVRGLTPLRQERAAAVDKKSGVQLRFLFSSFFFLLSFFFLFFYLKDATSRIREKNEKGKTDGCVSPPMFPVTARNSGESFVLQTSRGLSMDWKRETPDIEFGTFPTFLPGS